VKKLFVCLVVTLLAAGCNSNDSGGGSPTDPSQVNIELSFSDLVVGTGAGPAAAGNTASLNFELWLYNPAGTASKGTRIQGSSDPNPQVPGTTIGPITIILGTGQIVGTTSRVITGFEQGVRGMSVGGKRRIYIPSSLGYGSSGSGSTIPPNASIVFEVEMTSLVQ
jgi:FKBP-type peptidyl-prolyl cis-trans isomerase FkpA